MSYAQPSFLDRIYHGGGHLLPLAFFSRVTDLESRLLCTVPSFVEVNHRYGREMLLPLREILIGFTGSRSPSRTDALSRGVLFYLYILTTFTHTVNDVSGLEDYLCLILARFS